MIKSKKILFKNDFLLIKPTSKKTIVKNCEDDDDNKSLTSTSSCESFDSWENNDELLKKEKTRARVNFKKRYIKKISENH